MALELFWCFICNGDYGYWNGKLFQDKKMVVGGG